MISTRIVIYIAIKNIRPGNGSAGCIKECGGEYDTGISADKGQA
jgi:hypothetical protein